MSKFKLGYKIAKKLSNGNKSKQVKISVRVAIVSVAISIAVMIISSSIVLGFRNTISEKLFDFSADFQIVEASNYNLSKTKHIEVSKTEDTAISALECVKTSSRFVIKSAICRNGQNIKGIAMKGIDCDFDWQRFYKYIVEGETLDTEGRRKKNVLISQKLADDLNLSIGDKLQVYYIEESSRRDIFKISGLYSSSIPEIDNNIIYVDIRDLQRVNGWNENQISGYDIFINEGFDKESAKDEISKTLYTFDKSNIKTKTVVDTRSTYEYLFGWLDLLRTNELVIIIIMMIVSVFNVVSMMLIMLLQKTSMIGILKSLGMQNFTIKTIFVFMGMRSLFYGLIIGNIFGVTLCLLQKNFNLISLNLDSYMLKNVPIYLSFEKLILVNVLLITTLIISQLLATILISKIEPYKAIKYEKR